MTERLSTILAYHQVPYDDESMEEQERTSVSASLLAAQLDALKIDGWGFAPLQDVLQTLADDTRPAAAKEPILSVTFDDAYGDYLHAHEILARRGIPSTLFILTDFTGRDNLWNPRALRIRRHLSADELKELARAGVDLEFHGTDHHRLTKFTREEIDQRFRSGQEAFERMFGRRARIVAYPYGSWNEAVVDCARDYFEYGVSVSQGSWGGPGVRFRANRVEVTGNMSPQFLVRLLSAARHGRSALIRELGRGTGLSQAQAEGGGTT